MGPYGSSGLPSLVERFETPEPERIEKIILFQVVCTTVDVSSDDVCEGSKTRRTRRDRSNT
jgi:hypothetical protein